jgi:excisionase family DNA binding protein
VLTPLLKPVQVAAFLGIPVKGVHALCRAGKLDFIRINGKERRFTQEMVERYIQGQTVKNIKPVDKNTKVTLPCPPKGGVKSSGVIRAQLKEEMRSW